MSASDIVSAYKEDGLTDMAAGLNLCTQYLTQDMAISPRTKVIVLMTGEQPVPACVCVCVYVYVRITRTAWTAQFLGVSVLACVDSRGFIPSQLMLVRA